MKQRDCRHALRSCREDVVSKRVPKFSRSEPIDVFDAAYRDVRMVGSPFRLVAKYRKPGSQITVRRFQGVGAFPHTEPKDSRRPGRGKRSSIADREIEPLDRPRCAQGVHQSCCRVLFDLTEEPQGDVEVFLRDPPHGQVADTVQLTLKIADGGRARSSLRLLELNTNEYPHGQLDAGSSCTS